MEQDRYQKNHALFIIGLFSLVVSLSLFALCLYILPNLLFGWRYDTPGFIINWVALLQFDYNYSSQASSNIIVLAVFLLALFFAVIAYFASNRIDNQIYSAELEMSQEIKIPSRNRQLAIQLSAKILLIIILVVIVSALIDWLLYTPPQEIRPRNQFVSIIHSARMPSIQVS